MRQRKLETIIVTIKIDSKRKMFVKHRRKNKKEP